MAKVRGDLQTLDLLEGVEDAPRIDRYAPEIIRAATLGGKLSKAVARTLNDAKKRKDQPLSRETIADAMSQYLGEEVSKAVLDAYASQARESHNISLTRCLALMVATEDYRMLSLMADELGLAVVPKRFEGAVREAILAEQIEAMNDELKALRRGRKK